MIRIIRDAITGRFTRKKDPRTTVKETRFAWRAEFLALADELESEGDLHAARRIRETEHELR